MRRDEAVLLDILKAAKTARKFKGKTNKKDFLKDELIQSAILHQLIVVGEAVKCLSKEFRAHHPEIPWKLIAGMRDRITHGYFDIDLEEIWNTVDGDLPDLIKLLGPLVPSKDKR